MSNQKFAQFKGPFAAGEELIDRIDAGYVKKLGIQAKEGCQCKINGKVFEIGRPELLEFNDVRITSLSFVHDEPSSTLIDCIIE